MSHDKTAWQYCAIVSGCAQVAHAQS